MTAPISRLPPNSHTISWVSFCMIVLKKSSWPFYQLMIFLFVKHQLVPLPLLTLPTVDIRSIGNSMLLEDEGLWHPIPVDTFLEQMKSTDPKDRAFQIIIKPLQESIIKLSELDSSSAPKRRIAIFQVLLCKLIDILDNSVPWDSGPKFDSNEEPRYIPRNER